MKLSEVLWGPEVWCQGELVTMDNRHCLIGALDATKPPDRQAAWLRLYNLVGSSSPMGWNDAHTRTWEEVAAVVDEYDRLTMLDALSERSDGPEGARGVAG